MAARSSLPARVEPASFGRLQILAQLARFGGVGITATAVHAGLFLVLAVFCDVHPHMANILAFLVAFAVSFFGHSLLTFGTRLSIRNGTRFMIVAIAGLFLNVLNVDIITERLGLEPIWSLPAMILVVPLMTYLASRLWAFRPSPVE